MNPHPLRPVVRSIALMTLIVQPPLMGAAWAQASAPVEPTLGELARQRLARVLATQHKTDDALALLKGEASAAFIASREELRGDVLAQAGKRADARAAYEKARAAQKDANGAEALQIKLDNVTDGEA